MTASRPNRPSQKSRKVKALLAGGLVLGVGAAVTLAAWTDQEWAGSTFDAGSFNIQGTVDPSLTEETWDDHATSGDAAAIDFKLQAANLTPGDTVAGAFALRTDASTTYAATTELLTASATGAGDASNLTYGIFTVADFASCTPTATAADAGATSIVSAGSGFNAAPTGPNNIELAAGTTDTAGAPVVLCFQVTAKTTLEEGQSNDVTWNFEATSKQS